MPERINKAARPDYTPDPFYYSDVIHDSPAIVAWSQDAGQMEYLLLSLLDGFPPEVAILSKKLLPEEHPDIGWFERWMGTAELHKIKQVLKEFSEFVFQSAFYVLCIRNPETGEYIALDECGVLFYYTDSIDVLPVFESAGFTHARNELVSNGGCWMMSQDDDKDVHATFVEKLSLEAMQ